MLEGIIFISMTVCAMANAGPHFYFEHFATYEEAAADKVNDPYPEHCTTTIYQAAPVEEIPAIPPAPEEEKL